jgi:uncharacterized protein (TIGR02145 family)
MNDIISTHKNDVCSFLKNFILIFLFILSSHPFLRVSAQAKEEGLVNPKLEVKYILRPQLLPASPHQKNNADDPSPLLLETSCPNSNFNTGTWPPWVGCYGTFHSQYNNSPGILLPCTFPGFALHRHVIEHAPGYLDPYSCDTIHTVFPGEAFSARLGDTAGGGHAEQLHYNVTIGQENYLFIYRYAVVLESPNHIASQQPGFTIQVQDSSGILVDSCGYFSFTAPTCNNPPNCPNVAGWRYCPNVGYGGDGCYYKNWTTVGMNLTPYANLGKVSIVFTTRGCSFTAHRGYAYISAYCSAIAIQTALCEGQDSAILTAPPGFEHYAWTNGDTTQSITVPSVEGAIIECTLTAVNGCAVTISNTLHYTQIHTGFTQNMNCAQRPSAFNDTTWVSQNQVTAWRWFFGDPPSGSSDSSHLMNPTHSYSAPGPYTVKLISYSTEGCADTTTKQVVVDTLVTINNSITRSQICSGQHANIILTTNLANALYTWTATASSGTIMGFSDNAVPAPSPIDQILVNNGTQIDSVTYIISPHEGTCTGDPFTYVVVIFPKPNVNFNPVAPSICSGQNTNIALTSDVANTTFTWTATPGSGNVSGYGPGSGNTISQVLSTPGFVLETVTYHVVPSANTCPGDTTNVLVLINPRPHLVTNPMNQTICSNTTTNIILIASCPGTTYTWNSAVITGSVTGNTSGSGSPIVQTLINNLNTQGQVDYTIHPTAGSCIGNDTIFSVYVDPKPHVTTSPLTASVCSNETTSINLLSDVTGASFTWIATASSGNVSGFAAGSGSSIAQILINSGLTVETVTYHIVATANGCGSDTAYFVVTVHPLPIPAITGSASVCLNSTTVYGTSSGMSGYIWTVSPGGSIVSGGGTNSISVNWTTIGAQTISVKYTDTFGCTAALPTVFDVNVSLLPIPGLVGMNNVCIGSSTIYSSDPGMSSYIWIVSAGGSITAGGGPNDNSATVLWTVLGAQTVSVNYQAGPGCTASSPTVLNVTVQSLPVPAIVGSNSVCVGSTGNVYTAQAGMTGYSWSVSAGGTITAGGTAGDNTATITWNVDGAQTVSVNYTDGNGCTALAPTVYSVTVHILPAPTIAGPAGACNGSTGVVYSTEPGQSNYLWNLSGGGIFTAGGTTTDNTVTLTWNTPGVHTLTVNYHDANGCTAVSPSSYTITIYTLPVPVIGGNNKVCAGTTGVIYTTQPGMTNYTWAVSAGGIITAGGTVNDNTATVTWNTPGARTVSVNFNDPNGCTAVSATSYSVTVDPLPVPTITGNNNLCAGTTGVVYTTQAGMTNYTWTISAGGTITAGGSATNNTVTVTWNTAGAQTVMINYNDPNGCTAVTPTVWPVTVYPLPIPVVTGSAMLCAGTTGEVYSTQPGNSNYSWVVSAGGTITAGAGTNAVAVTWNTPGAQFVSVNYHDGNGCTAVSPTLYPVTINPLPVPVITGPAATCLNSTAVYSTAPGMSNYTWTITAGGIIISGASTNTVTINCMTLGGITLTVNYIDGNGCTAVTPSSYTITVNFLPIPSLAGINSLCTGLSAIYTTDAGMSNYSWNVSAGGAITGGGGTTDNTVTILWNTPGLQTVSVNYVMGSGCTASQPTIYNITVKPRPSVTNASNSSMCSNGTTNIVPTASLMGTTFSWTAAGSSGSVTGYNPGAGFSITDNLINSGFNIENVNYSVTPSLNGCDGTIAHYIVTVNPVADVYFNPNGQSFCSGGTTSISILSHVAGATFTWTAVGSSGYVSGFGPGSGSLIAQTLNNSGPYFENVNYDVFPIANFCPGTDNHVIVNMNPTPAVSFDMACNDIITKTDAKPFTLRGGIPLGGVYSGPGVNAGIFYPSLAGPGTITINYSYSNTWGCNSNQSQTISVIGAVSFPCDNLLTDIRDNKQYPTIKIGTQCWMAMNLDIGTQIPSTAMQRDNCVIEKYCYNDIIGNCFTMGGRYQWDEMMRFEDTPALQGICPPSWHVPSETDWTTLFNFYTSNGFAGSPLKYDGFSGFNALLDGVRFDNSLYDFTNFATFFWSSNSRGPDKAWAHAMNFENPSVSNYPGNRSNAFSIRCMKD